MGGRGNGAARNTGSARNTVVSISENWKKQYYDIRKSYKELKSYMEKQDYTELGSSQMRSSDLQGKTVMLFENSKFGGYELYPAYVNKVDTSWTPGGAPSVNLHTYTDPTTGKKLDMSYKNHKNLGIFVTQELKKKLK